MVGSGETVNVQCRHGTPSHGSRDHDASKIIISAVNAAQRIVRYLQCTRIRAGVRPAPSAASKRRANRLIRVNLFVTLPMLKLTDRKRGETTMQSATDKGFILLFRLLMAWTFLYAASHQVFVPGWSVAGFLAKTKTFHDLFAMFATPSIAPIITVLVGYGHLLIGLSLLVGLMVRVSASFGILLMLLYWMAHMDFPYIENANNFIVDYHIVYASLLGYLVYRQAGYVLGLDALASKVPLFRAGDTLHPLIA
jgi:thiosulfate dehydrogenase (quinone) large subunit